MKRPLIMTAVMGFVLGNVWNSLPKFDLDSTRSSLANSRSVKYNGMTRTLEGQYGKGKEGRMIEVIEKEGTNGLRR